MLTIAANVPTDDLKALRGKALKENRKDVVTEIDHVLGLRESGAARPSRSARNTLKRMTETKGPDPVRKPAAAERDAAAELLVESLTPQMTTDQFRAGLARQPDYGPFFMGARNV